MFGGLFRGPVGLMASGKLGFGKRVTLIVTFFSKAPASPHCMFQSPWKTNLYVCTLLLFSTVLGTLASDWLYNRVSFQHDESHQRAATGIAGAAKTDSFEIRKPN